MAVHYVVLWFRSEHPANSHQKVGAWKTAVTVLAADLLVVFAKFGFSVLFQ